MYGERTYRALHSEHSNFSLETFSECYIRTLDKRVYFLMIVSIIYSGVQQKLPTDFSRFLVVEVMNTQGFVC